MHNKVGHTWNIPYSYLLLERALPTPIRVTILAHQQLTMTEMAAHYNEIHGMPSPALKEMAASTRYYS